MSSGRRRQRAQEIVKRLYSQSLGDIELPLLIIEVLADAEARGATAEREVIKEKVCAACKQDL